VKAVQEIQAVSEEQRVLVEERHLHSAGHWIIQRRAVFRWLYFLERRLLIEGLQGKHALSDTHNPRSLLGCAVRSKSKLIDVLLRIDPDTLQGLFKLLQVLGQHLRLEGHGRI